MEVSTMAVTVTLFDYIKSELIKRGLNEFQDSNGKFVFFDEEAQFITMILGYDKNVADIVDHLFTGVSLNQRVYDSHFKKAFLYRFLNRQINRQTIEAFRVELLSTFISNNQYLNNMYENLDQFITQSQTNENTNKQKNEQLNDGKTTTDNRQAFANLPQNNVQLDVDNTVMDSASDNTISRNKQTNNQKNTGETTGESVTESKSYQFDALFKSNGLLEQLLNEFDKKCFMQVW